MSFNLEVLDLNGSYVTDQERTTDSIEELLRISGAGWAIRKTMTKFGKSLAVTINYTEARLVQTFKASIL